MATSLYPIKEIKDFSELLVQFERGLNQIVTGNASFSIQIKDLPVFRRIKSKIEQLPFLKEIFSLNSRSSYLLKSKKRMVSTEKNLFSVDNGTFGNIACSIDVSANHYSKPTSLNSSLTLGRNGPRLPPVTSQPFILDKSRDLQSSQVCHSIRGGLEVCKEMLEKFKKLKIAIFNSTCHRVDTSKLLLECFIFILMGSRDSKLAVCKIKEEEQRSSSLSPHSKKKNFKVEEEYSRQFNLQGEKMKSKRYSPEDLHLFGIDRALAEDYDFDYLEEGLHFMPIATKFLDSSKTWVRFSYSLGERHYTLYLSRDEGNLLSQLLIALHSQNDASVDDIFKSFLESLNMVLSFEPNSNNPRLQYAVFAAINNLERSLLKLVHPLLREYLSDTENLEGAQNRFSFISSLGKMAEEYSRIAAMTDFYAQDDKNQHLVFKKQELVLKIESSEATNFSEMYYTVSALLDAFSFDVESQLRQAEYLYMYREFDTLRIVMTFNKSKQLADQSGFYFPGLNSILKTDMTMGNLSFQKMAKFESIFKHEDDQEVANFNLQKMSLEMKCTPTANKAIKFTVKGVALELVPQARLTDSAALISFTMIVYRNIKLTIPFLCAKQILKISENTYIKLALKSRSDERRMILSDIGNSNTLRETILLIGEYLQTVYSLNRHEVIQSFNRNEATQLIVV